MEQAEEVRQQLAALRGALEGRQQAVGQQLAREQQQMQRLQQRKQACNCVLSL